MKLACRVCTPSELTRLRLAIAKGAQGLISGKYDTAAIEGAAKRIATIIEGAHIREVREIEEIEGFNFRDRFTNLIVEATIEMASKATSPYLAIFPEEKKESEKREGLKII
jgi:hypothetical protein